MDAVKFIQERGRMCRAYGDKCAGCPAANVSADAPACALDIESQVDSKKQVTIVEEWSAAHPRKTRQSVFLEQWPDAAKDRGDTLSVCPQYLEKNLECDITGNCQSCRRKFWMQEVE